MGSDRRDICILVACKRSIVCELYSQALNRHSGFRVIAGAITADEVLRELRTTAIDVALISTALGDGPRSGLALLEQIQECHPSVKSILLFDRDETDLVVPAFRAGARGVFCAGQEEFKNLCRCVDRVHSGQVWANSLQLGQVLEAFSRQPAARLVKADGLRLLSRREEDVVRLVQEGYTNREIARELHLSEHTVRNNLFRVFDKLGVSTRVELVLYSINNSKRVPMSDGDDQREPRGYEERHALVVAPVQ
jgi:DNA-binding NarL/FixJ family response regulator